MSSYSVLNTVPIRNILRRAEPNVVEDKINGGLLADTNLSWVACGPHISFVDCKTGRQISKWVFGAVMKDSTTKVVAVHEIKSKFKEVSLVVVGLECMGTGGMVCVYDLFSGRVLRAIQFDNKVNSLQVVNSGGDCFPGSLGHFDGTIVVGTSQGDVFIVDLCRQSIDEVRPITSVVEIRNEINPCQLMILHVDQVDRIESLKEIAERNGNHLAIHINGTGMPVPHFVLKGPKGDDRIHVNKEEVCVSSLFYSRHLNSIFVGYNFGAMQIWDLTTMNLTYTSPVNEDNTPISHFAIQEPIDDPRAFCYFWAVYSNTEPSQRGFAVAVLYSLCYESKDWHEGYGYIYQNFMSCTARFQVDLGADDNADSDCGRPIGAQCIRLHSFKKGLGRNLINSSPVDQHTEDVYTLCLMVWNVYFKNRSSKTYLIVFDLNQWYKEQMPSSPHIDQSHVYMSFGDMTKVINNKKSLLDVHIDSKTISQFVGTQRLEEHYYPSSISFQYRALTEQDIYFLKNNGLQRQFYRDLESGGSLSLIKPTELYEMSIRLGLTPLFEEPQGSSLLTYQREFLLNVALERRMENWLCKCALSWSNGSHRSAGLSLDFMLKWAWQRTNVLKNNVDKICVPLFDYTEVKLDGNANSHLSSCRCQIRVLRALYCYIYKKCSGFLINASLVKQQFNCLDRIYTYIDVLGWMVNVGLLPECPASKCKQLMDYEKIAVPYPVSTLEDYYSKRREMLIALKTEKRLQGCKHVLYIDKLIELVGKDVLRREWQCDGGSGNYPPASLQALLRTYLIEDVDMEYKHCIVSYLLMDLAATLNEEKYKAVIPTLIKFPSIFNVSNSVVKLTQGFWHLDHGNLGAAGKQLIDPMIKSSDLKPYHHQLILHSLLLKDHAKLALHYLKIRQPTVNTFEDVSLIISLHVANKMLREAFSFYRRHSSTNRSELLQIIFRESFKTSQLEELTNLNLNKSEEEELFKFIKSVHSLQEDNFKSRYLLQRGRIYDFYSMQQGKTKSSANFGKTICEILDNALPAVNRDILASCVEKSNIIINKDGTSKPMSIFMHNQEEHVKYKCNFISASISKSRDTWVSGKDVDWAKVQPSDDNLPFFRSPKLFLHVKEPSSDLIYPKIVSSSSLHDGIVPCKRMRLSPNAMPKTSEEVEAEDELHELTTISTPIIKRKSARVAATASNVIDAITPQSILKTRRITRKSMSVDRDDATTPENLDDIDDVELERSSVISATRDTHSRRSSMGLGVSGRKSLTRTSIVRFSGISSTTTSSNTSNVTKSTESPKEQSVLNTITSNNSVVVSNEDKNSSLSTSQETYYSPETTLDNDDVTEKADKLVEHGINDTNEVGEKRLRKSSMSLRCRKSYKEDTPRKYIARPSKGLSNKTQSNDLEGAFNTGSFVTVKDNTSIAKIVETSVCKTEVTKLIDGNTVKETVDKYVSENKSFEIMEDGVENIQKQGHEEISKSIRQEVTLDDENDVFNPETSKYIPDVEEEEEEMEVDEPELDLFDQNTQEVELVEQLPADNGNQDIHILDETGTQNSALQITTGDIQVINNSTIYSIHNENSVFERNTITEEKSITVNVELDTNQANENYIDLSEETLPKKDGASDSDVASVKDDENVDIYGDLSDKTSANSSRSNAESNDKDSTYESEESLNSLEKARIEVISIGSSSSRSLSSCSSKSSNGLNVAVIIEETSNSRSSVRERPVEEDESRVEEQNQQSETKNDSATAEESNTLFESAENSVLLGERKLRELNTPNPLFKSFTSNAWLEESSRSIEVHCEKSSSSSNSSCGILFKTLGDAGEGAAKQSTEETKTDGAVIEKEPNVGELNTSHPLFKSFTCASPASKEEIAPPNAIQSEKSSSSSDGILFKELNNDVAVEDKPKDDDDEENGEQGVLLGEEDKLSTDAITSKTKKNARQQSLRRTSVDSPTGRTLRSRKGSTSQLEETPKRTTRARSASIDKDVVHAPARRNQRSKSVNDTEEAPKVKSTRLSSAMPAIEEEEQKDNKKRIGEFLAGKRLTKRQEDLMRKKLESSSVMLDEANRVELDLKQIDPIQLLEKTTFEGTPDPDEARVRDSPVSSLADSTSTVEVHTRSKRAASVASDRVSSKVSPRKKKAGAKTSIASDAVDTQAPSTSFRKTRSKSTDSVEPVTFVRSTRSRTRSVTPDVEIRPTKLKLSELDTIDEESQAPAKALRKRGRPKQTDK